MGAGEDARRYTQESRNKGVFAGWKENSGPPGRALGRGWCYSQFVHKLVQAIYEAWLA